MDNFISIAVVFVFLLLVYTYASGKIEKRKNGKAAKKAGRFPAAAETEPRIMKPSDEDVFTDCRVLVISLRENSTLRDFEISANARISHAIRQFEDLGGYDVRIESLQPYVDDLICVIVTCRRPHVKDEG